KTMGIIVSALIATGHLGQASVGVAQHVPFWVVLLCHAALGLGTLSGGWRIVRTLGMKITRLPPAGGFCAEASGALTLFFETSFAIPVSTTQTIAGAIVGAGSTRKVSAVRWGIAGRIVWAWLLTVPGSASIGAVTYLLLVAAGGSR
ncbi:MAG: inorganic phosphate transporter, partial [Polyangiales bacterium]